MSELPSVFSKTRCVPPLPSEVLDSLDPARRAAYEKLHRCADDLKAADAAVAGSISNIKVANDAVTEHEKFMTAHFPKVTFHDLWKSEVKGQ